MSLNLIELNKVSKSFPGVKALDQVSFDLKKGEVHALLGENGAGKSTLMKIISGIYKRDEGTYFIDGKDIGDLTPKKAADLGIAIIHQELNMCQDLTVAENMFLGREKKKYGFVDQKSLNEDARIILEKLQMDIDPEMVVRKLPVSKQQMIEIAKALSTNARILIMDEPTSALTEKECVELFKIINNLKKNGCAIIYISHRLEELEHITDRVSVFRDGKYIITKNYKDTSLDEIIAYMVGREITDKYPNIQMPLGDKILEVNKLNAGMLKDISFDLFSGEIVGFSGLMGAGRTELFKTIFGADKKESGEIILDGHHLNIKSPEDAIRYGIVLGPEDRKSEGLCTKLSIRENIALANLDQISNKFGFIDKEKEAEIVDKMISDLKIKTPSMEQDAKNLSGGNQQKVVVGKWLARDARVVVFDEPTRGIDVAAKVEIYNIMNELKRQGVGVIFISSELPEIMGMSDRVLVMCNGRITGNLMTSDTSQDEILHCATRYSN
ncbi:sugar ABC transporter ATP-binding protein [Acidaminobacter sp. JC074]|uniref:sugar ABC transporter ATP-binding protein n=1 Tax=Acidaminobacter sp. JC074 TaxID=2530199 RepID=UPI001F10EB9F|nr:sugar ABC transporter ATP-binding protein [Acidaminobacter sp. JC074]MCH4887953.1 sugar ABC transporter ATP-binding protein [Acidaminobacter sp. JC074]